MPNTGKPPFRERGSAFIEFLFCMSFLLLPLMLGVMVLGMNVIRAIQVTGLCRSAAHMYSENVDFSQTQNQQELIAIAQGLNITTTSGNGVIIFSKVTYITAAMCTAGGYSSGCANENQYAIVNRLVIGNSGLYSSQFGTPPSADMDPSGTGNVIAAGYLNDPSCVANNFASFLALPAGQYAYVAEAYFVSPDLNWWGWGMPQVSTKFVF